MFKFVKKVKLKDIYQILFEKVIKINYNYGIDQLHFKITRFAKVLQETPSFSKFFQGLPRFTNN